jgi:plastocyanin
MTKQWWYALAAAGILVTACGGERAPADQAGSSQPAATATPAGGPATPDAGGKVVLVEMETDAAGVNKFEPATVTARRGDVVRFTLISGVHNVHFLADSNPGKAGLPPASALLQLPHQTYDLKVTWEPGTYYFQCDPHALLGMVGHLTVEP